MGTANKTVRRLSEVVEVTGGLDPTLAAVEGQPVIVTAATVELKHGVNGPFPITTVILQGGESFTVAGNGVANVLGLVPDDAYPVEVIFESVPSRYDPARRYWIAR